MKLFSENYFEMYDKENKTPNFSTTNREEVPDQYKWKVTDIFENSDKWEIEKESVKIEIKKISDFRKTWDRSGKDMYEFFIYLNQTEMRLSKLYSYTSLNLDTNIEDSKYQSMKGDIYNIYIGFDTITNFISPRILELGTDKINEFKKDFPKLEEYNRTFDIILRLKEHILPEEKSEIISMTSLFADAPSKASGILNDMEIPYTTVKLENEEEIELNITNYEKYRRSSNKELRRKVMESYWTNHNKFRNTHAVLMNANINQHFFNAKIHKYNTCLEASLKPKKIDLNVYHNLIKTIKSNLNPLFKYIKLKKKLLKLDDIKYSDIYASSISKIDKSYSIEEAKQIILKAVKPLGEDYINVLNNGFESAWMDIYPNKNKRSGAYSNGSIYDVHPYVLMNFNGTYNNVSTLAHEFGHALHSYYSNKNNAYHLSSYPIFLAEIASTFNETMLNDYIMENETDKTFILYILDQYIENLRATLYRQTLFAEFELAMHEEVEAGKTLTADWLDEKYLKLTREYYGHDEGIMEVDEYIKNEWSFIPHFYYNFYVYQYSTGIIAATSLVEKIKTGDTEARDKYLKFLQSGGSDYPLEILKRAGVDLTKSEAIELTLKKFEAAIDKMEDLSIKLGLI